MKKYLVLIMVFLVTLPVALAQEDDAGILGPEHGVSFKSFSHLDTSKKMH